MKTILKQLGVALHIIFLGLVCLIPTPTYGKHGGFYNECDEEPIDEMDGFYKIHDTMLKDNFNKYIGGIKLANLVLYNNLRDNPIEVDAHWYKKFYYKMSLFIFFIGSR